MVLNMLTMILWKTEQSLAAFPKNAMPASIAGLCNTIMLGLLTSGNWIYTAISIYIVFFITLSYNSIMFAYVDYLTILLLSITIILLTFLLYKMEQKDKMEFLSFKQIMQMND